MFRVVSRLGLEPRALALKEEPFVRQISHCIATVASDRMRRVIRRAISRFGQYSPPHSWYAGLAGLPQIIGSLLCHPHISTASIFHAKPFF